MKKRNREFLGVRVAVKNRLLALCVRSVKNPCPLLSYCAFVTGAAGFGAGLCTGAACGVPPACRIVTLLIFTGVSGLSFPLRGTRAICLTISMLGKSHCPKIV